MMLPLVFAFTFAAAAPAEPVPATMPCPSPTHYDGDDIRCDSDYWHQVAGKGGMRLGKVDAPEIRCSRKPGGKACQKAEALASRDHLRTLTGGHRVTCEWTGERTSVQTGARPVVMCKADEAGDLSCAQWRGGHASYTPHFDPKKRFRNACQR